jgi:hypothetical protein
MDEIITELSVTLLGGVITGVQVRKADGVQREVQAGDVDGVIAGVNEAALLTIDALTIERDSLKAQIDAYKARGLAAAQAVLDAPDKATCDAIAADIRRDERERQRLAALARLAQAQAEADKFN